MKIFPQFPKERPELPEDYQKIYTEHYIKNREGQYKSTSLSSKLERWLHRKVAKDLKKSENLSTTLEIGAGNLNQLDFESKGKIYDIIEPFKDLIETSSHQDKIDNIYDDIDDVPLSNKYSRITAIASFEHICNLPHVVAKSALLLTEEGSLRVSIPNEGTIMWSFGDKVTGYDFKRTYGLDYKVIRRHDHVNNAREIEEVLKFFFKETKCSVFGLSKGLAFYRFYECKIPNIDNAKSYLQQSNTAGE